MKTLVSASTIRACHERGESLIAAPLSSTIVTPEARDLAAKFDIVVDQTNADSGRDAPVPESVGEPTAQCAAERIQQAVAERLPADQATDSALIERLVRQTLRELEATEPTSGSCQRQLADNGVVLVRGDSVQMGRFDGVPDKPIGLTDVITSADQARMSAGYMAWDDAFFPWTLNYDEIDVVLEGELHIRAGGQTYIGGPGDVFFIPNGASIEFGTPTSVRFVYVTYPADWAG